MPSELCDLHNRLIVHCERSHIEVGIERSRTTLPRETASSWWIVNSVPVHSGWLMHGHVSTMARMVSTPPP